MGQRGGMGGGAAVSNEVLVSFKAGQCHCESKGDGSFEVVPKKGKGTLKVTKSPEGMTEVVWEDRKTKEDKETHMAFPGDAELTNVDTGKEGDR